MINTRKHYVQSTLFSIGSTSTENVVLVDAKTGPTLANDVQDGSEVSAVYVELWLLGAAAQPGTTLVTLEKVPGNAPLMVHSDAQVLNDYGNKKNILEAHQGIIGDSNSNPIPMFRHWVKIPKGKRRMGLDDRIVLNVSNLTTDGIEACGIYTYKEKT